jgi:hypothetical protein
MDLNGYIVEMLAHSHLDELRATAERHALVRRLRGRRPLRWTLGQALVSLGTRLRGDLSPARASA